MILTKLQLNQFFQIHYLFLVSINILINNAMSKKLNKYVRIKKPSNSRSISSNKKEKSNWLRILIIIILHLILLLSRMVFKLMWQLLNLLFLLFSLQVLACHSKHLNQKLIYLVHVLLLKEMINTSKESNAYAITTIMVLEIQFRLLYSNSIKTHLYLHFSNRNTP